MCYPDKHQFGDGTVSASKRRKEKMVMNDDGHNTDNSSSLFSVAMCNLFLPLDGITLLDYQNLIK